MVWTKIKLVIHIWNIQISSLLGENMGDKKTSSISRYIVDLQFYLFIYLFPYNVFEVHKFKCFSLADICETWRW